MTEAERITSEALELPDDERVEVALRILDSLGAPDPHAHLSDAEFMDLITERVRQVERGDVQTLSWDEVRTRIRTKLNL